MIYMVKTAVFIELILLLSVAVYWSCLQPRHRGIVAGGDILLIVAIPIIGLFGHDKNVFYGFLFVAPLFWTGDPTRLAKCYILGLASFPELKGPYLVGSLYLADWSALLAFNAGALVALAVSRRGGLKPVRPIDAALWLLFLIAIIIFGRGAAAGGVIRAIVTTFVLIIPPYFVVARLIGSPRAAADATSFLVLAGVENAAVALVESLKHWSLYESLAGAMNIRLGEASANLSVRAGFLRAGGVFVNYEMLGLLCGLSLMAAVAVRRRFTGGGFYVIVLLLAAGLLSSQARSAWIATAVGILVQAIYQRRWTRVGAFVGIGLAGALALAAAPREGVAGQLTGASGHAESTGEYRQRLLDRGLEEARQHPLAGQTNDQLQVSMNDLRQGQHIIDFVNTHLNVVLVGGVGALLLWLVAWGVPLVRGWRYRARYRGDLEPSMAALAFAILTTIFLFLAFTSAIDRALPFTAVGMALMSVGLRLPMQAREGIGGRERRNLVPVTPQVVPAA